MYNGHVTGDSSSLSPFLESKPASIDEATGGRHVPERPPCESLLDSQQSAGVLVNESSAGRKKFGTSSAWDRIRFCTCPIWWRSIHGVGSIAGCAITGGKCGRLL